MINKPKVLYLVSARSFGSHNPGRKISEVIKVWQELGVNLKVIFGKDIESSSSNNSYGNQQYHNSTVRKNNILKPLVNSYSELKDIVHNRRLYKKIIKEDLELNLIWERSCRLHWSGLKIAKKLKIPFVLEWKDNLINYKYSLFRPLSIYLENKKIKEANYIVVESLVLKNDLINKGVNSEKIHIALNAVNSVEFVSDVVKGNEFKETNSIPLANKVVGYLGSYAFYHNTQLLIKAAAIVLKTKKNVSFIMVGNGQDYDECLSLAKNLNILNNGLIMLNGVSKEYVPNVLSAIDISVLPGSTDIICPIKIMEYMAAETVVCAPDYLCNREVINEDTGVLFEPNNENDLAAKILYTIDNPKFSLNCAKEARKYVKNNLTWENTWGRTLLNIIGDEKNHKK